MILKAYSFLDTKTGIFSTPFYFLHEGQAIRAAIDIGSDLSTSVGRHPADYHLYFIGEFDDNTGLYSVVGPVGMGAVIAFLPVKAAQFFDKETI